MCINFSGFKNSNSHQNFVDLYEDTGLAGQPGKGLHGSLPLSGSGEVLVGIDVTSLVLSNTTNIYNNKSDAYLLIKHIFSDNSVSNPPTTGFNQVFATLSKTYRY